jgi:hypothetical protein
VPSPDRVPHLKLPIGLLVLSLVSSLNELSPTRIGGPTADGGGPVSPVNLSSSRCLGSIRFGRITADCFVGAELLVRGPAACSSSTTARPRSSRG